MSRLDYDLRQNEKCKTRIKMGYGDLELYKRMMGAGRWQKVQLPKELPQVDTTRSGSVGSLSPAPGRPNRGRGEGRSRHSSGSHEIMAKTTATVLDTTSLTKSRRTSAKI